MSIKRSVYLSILLFFSLTLSNLPLAEGGQMAILRIVLNQEEKGEFFVFVTADGDFLVRIEDLKKIGITEIRGKVSILEGEEYISLRSMEGVKTVFDEKKLALELTADPRLLGKKIINLRFPRQTKVYYPRDIGGFLNYNLTYYAGDSLKYDRTLLTNQLGFRWWDLHLFSDSSYTQRKGEGAKFVRLMSNLTYDRREDLRRLILGDFFASSGELGSTVNMGGVSFSKNYRIDPYFITFPEIDFSGMASLPSEIEIYRDGVLIRKERVSPGSFELKDIPTYVGSGLIEIVLKDPFGKEERIMLPYYFSDTLLKKGLHEYSYNAGFLREDFGTVSNQYQNFVFLGSQRYGISDSLTAGIRAEASNKIYNLGLFSTFLIPWRLGIIHASVAWSDSEGRRDGIGGSVNYVYLGRNLSFNFRLSCFSRDYSNIVLDATKERVKYEVSAGASYFSSLLGSLSLGASTTQRYVGKDARSIIAGYSRKITNRFNLMATFKRDLESNVSEFMVGLNYYFKHGITASSSYQKADRVSRERIQVMKSLPVGEGFGGRASFEANQVEPKDFNHYNLQLQYNAPYGQYMGEFSSTNRVETYSLTAAGGITFVKDSLNLTRPVRDSFAVVKVGDLKGVRVYLNNQEIGRTNRAGKVLIPNLGSYYENQISINDKDIPIEYQISDVLRYVSPPLRSGSYIEFTATKIQSFFGSLKLKHEKEIKPLEYIEVRLTVDGKELVIPTGKGGEFYFENIRPGEYRGEFKYLEKTYFFNIIVPKSDELMVDLGEIICE